MSVPVIQGPVIKGPVIQGWCPGALRPMASGDGLVVRVRPHAGRLSAEQAAGIARLAGLHGNGLIDLSARANVQVRGVTEASFPALIDGLRALGLIDANAEAEARRNIVVSPFWGDGDGVTGIAGLLAEVLARADAPALPAKFGFAVDGGTPAMLRGVSADIRIERHTDGWLVWGDGFATGAVVGTPAAAVAAALELARWFVAAGGVRQGRGRMAGVREARLPAGFGQGMVPVVQAAVPVPGVYGAGRLVGFEFGQIGSDTLLALAGLGAVRVTPWRMLLVEGVGDVPDLPGVIVAPDDPMLRVVACTGAPGCLQGLAATRGLARALAPYMHQTLHVSGCAKGCAHPGAALTLVAAADGFDLIGHGTAKDAPLRRGLQAGDLVADPDLLVRAAR